MATESIEEFLARGGKVDKSTEETSLQELLKSEGLLDSKTAEKAQNELNEAITKTLNTEFKQ